MIDKDGIEKNVSVFNTIKYIENHSTENYPIYIVAHNGNNFDFLYF